MNSRLFFGAPLVLPLLLVACESQELKSLLERQDYFDRQIAIYEERVQKATQKLEAEKKEFEKEFERAQPAVKSLASRESMLAEIRELIGGLATMENAMLEKAGLIDAYKATFKPKSIPNETNLGDLVLPNGTAYKSVVVKESTETHLNIAHSGGFSQVPFHELPEGIKAQIVSAPIESAVVPNPRDVISRKPSSIKSEAEHASERQRAIQLEQQAREAQIAKIEADRAETLRKEEERDKSDAAYRQNLEVYAKELGAIDEQIKVITSQISSLENQKSDMEYANTYGKVRLARADFIKKLKPFDDQIQELNAQIARLQSKKASLTPPPR